MEAYTGFAAVYDEFMAETPYDEVAAYLQKLLEKYGVTEGLLLELGCGTGEMTLRMAEKGFDMIGIDASEEMLSEAKMKGGENILYLLQDMRSFELYGTVAGVFAVTDSMNYMTEREDFIQVLRLVNNYLDPKGIFLFDLKTEHFYRDILADRTFADHSEDATLIWENTYDEEQALNEYAITLFLREKDGRYTREEEYHYQRAYSISEIREMIAEAGMTFVGVVRAYTEEELTEEHMADCQRIFVIAREEGKQNE